MGGVNLGPVVSAQVFTAQGWHWVFWYMSIAEGVALVAAYFLVAETVYLRKPGQTAATSSGDSPGPEGEEKKADGDVTGSYVVRADTEHPRYTPTYRDSLRIFSGSKHQSSLAKIIIRPWFHLTAPGVWLGIIVFSVSFNWLPLLGGTYAQIFSAPPYSFSVSSIGIFAGIAAFIGTLIGTFSAGPFSDWFAKAYAKRNRGVFESEFRLILLLWFAVFGAVGAFGWAFSAADNRPWPVIAVVRSHS